MKNILLVDDEQPFLLSLKDGLTAYSNDFTILMATTVPDALTILKKIEVDLLLTDLKLPGADGFQLLATISRTHPHLPVIVMTAFGTPEIEARLSKMSALHYLEKPLDFDELTRTIESALTSESLSFIRGITLATFLQLVHMERKTCSLKVRKQERTGYLFLHKGELLDAQTGDKSGETAALDILSWDETEIEMDNICRRTEAIIKSSLEFLLMEAFRIKGERETGLTQTLDLSASTAPKNDESVELLLDLLTRTPEIQAFARFDDNNFLADQHGASDLLARMDAATCLELCDQLEHSFNGGDLRYLQFTTESKRRHLLFRHHRHSIAVTLAQGARTEKVMAEIAATCGASEPYSVKGES